MEQKTYTVEDSRALLDTPVEPFKEDLRRMCRAVFGPGWMDRHPGQEAMDRLRAYGFLPKIFLAMYEVLGGEERLHRLGLLPAERVELDQQPGRGQTAQFLVFYHRDKVEYSFSRYQIITGHPHLDKPFCGVYRFRYDNLFYTKKWKVWEKWCSWGGQSQFQTLSTALLRLVGETLIRALPNCAWVRVPAKKEGELSQYESLARRLGCLALESVYPIGWEYLCDPERGLLVRYFDEDRKKVLIYSRDPAHLEALGERWPLVWQRREGKKVLDPAKFIQ